MRFTINGSNKESAHEGVLYCAQRIEEMLMGYTSHLYKVPVYNSFLLVNEYLETASLVQSCILDKSHLKIIIDEFIHTFRCDMIIKEHFSDKEINYFFNSLKDATLFEQKKMMNFLLHRMKNYPIWCADILKIACSMPQEKKRMESILRSYVPMLIGAGYSPDYIYWFCLKIFENDSLSDVTSVGHFFKRFDLADNDYDVYYAIDKKFKQFSTVLERIIDISFEEDEYTNALKYDKKRYICVHQRTSALDNNRAVEQVYRNFSLFVRYYSFLSDRNERWHDETAMVIDSHNNKFFIPFKPLGYLYPKVFDDKIVGKNSERVIAALLENTGTTDFNRINKIIKIHNIALNSEDTNNAFLNLWSIMEIIGISDREESKIQEVLKSVVPILLHNYAKNVFKQIYCYLKDNLEENDFRALLQTIAIGENEIEKIAFMIALPSCKVEREYAYNILSDFPLLRNRIFVLRTEIFEKKSKFIKKLNNYKQRLEWHIQRIYRVRNSIIHSGESSERIRDLVEHLHAYIDEIIFEIIERMIQEDSLVSIENVLVYNKVYIDNLIADFNCESDFTESDVARLFE